MDATAQFNSYSKVLAGIILSTTNAEVDICRSHEDGALINILVIDAKKAKRVAQVIRKASRRLKIVKKIDYPAIYPGETDSTLLVYGEAV